MEQGDRLPADEGGYSVGWLTIPEAAERWGVSPRTVRRWIKEQKVTADLQPGPYGETYHIAANHPRPDGAGVAAKLPAGDVQALAQAVDTRVNDQYARVLTALDTLRVEVRQGVSADLDSLRDALTTQVDGLRATLEQVAQQQAAREQAIRDELAAIRRELRQGPQPWWRRLFGLT